MKTSRSLLSAMVQMVSALSATQSALLAIAESLPDKNADLQETLKTVSLENSKLIDMLGKAIDDER
jgi:hypothetical protein